LKTGIEVFLAAAAAAAAAVLLAISTELFARTS
jgi:hypothetical protein